MNFFFKFVDFDLMIIFFLTLTLKNNYEKKYYKIIKFEIYKKNSYLNWKNSFKIIKMFFKCDSSFTNNTKQK